MDEKNYEDILKRRQERWKDEKKRRRKKVLLIYGLISNCCGRGRELPERGLWRRHSMSNSETSGKEKQESSSEQDPQKEESAKTPGKRFWPGLEISLLRRRRESWRDRWPFLNLSRMRRQIQKKEKVLKTPGRKNRKREKRGQTCRQRKAALRIF